MQIDTCNPGKHAWNSFWEPDLSGYTGSYFQEQEKKRQSQFDLQFDENKLQRHRGFQSIRDEMKELDTNRQTSIYATESGSYGQSKAYVQTNEAIRD